jgi:hypothetical protein
MADLGSLEAELRALGALVVEPPADDLTVRVLAVRVLAAVVEWLRIGGIVIRISPPVSGPSPTPQPPPRSDPTVSLAEAQAKVASPSACPTPPPTGEARQVSACG